MKKFLLLATLTLFFVQCSKKTAPIDTSNMSPEQAAFTNNCKKCHGLPKPDKHTAADWIKTVDRMQSKPRAQFSNEVKAQIMTYLTATAKK